MDPNIKNYCYGQNQDDISIKILFTNSDDGINSVTHEFMPGIQQCQTSHEASRNSVKTGLRYLDSPATDGYTQTSKTILQLANLELGDMTPDSLSPKTDTMQQDSPRYEEPKPYVEDIYLPYNRKKYVVDYLNSQKFVCEQLPKPQTPNESLTKVFLNKIRGRDKGDLNHNSDSTINKSLFLQQTSPLKNVMDCNFKSKSCIEDRMHQVDPEKQNKLRNNRFTIKNVTEFNPVNNATPVKFYCQYNSTELPDDVIFVRPNNQADEKKEISFMSPTIASLNKNRIGEIERTKNTLPPIRRGNTLDPLKKEEHKKIPYIDCESASADTGESALFKNAATFRTAPEVEKLNLFSETERMEFDVNSLPNDNGFMQSMNAALYRIRACDWNVSLRGLSEIIDLCRNSEDVTNVMPYMTAINQRLIELLRSPRSHVCRTACQASGHLFEYVKDTRRPEFDEIVDSLLCKTADSNKFIRQDANLALDCMVTHIAPIHSVRALCLKGPNHKNNLVRFAVARLLVCVVVITGVEKLLLPSNSENTRRRLFCNMIKIIRDKHSDTRKMGERLYKLLNKDAFFEVYLKKYLEKEEIVLIRKLIK